MAKSPTPTDTTSADAEFVSPACVVTAKVAGFRRAGMAHGVAPTRHEAGTFTAEQFEALIREPALVVVPAPTGVTKPAEAAGGEA